MKRVLNLINKGANVNARDQFRETPLHYAVLNNHSEIVKVLLEHNADANARNWLEETPLHLAAEKGFIKIVRLLLSYAADVNARDTSGETPLHKAARSGHFNVVKELVSYGADVNAKNNNDLTPADLAEQNNHPKIAKYLRNLMKKAQSKQSSRYELIEDLETVVSIAISVGLWLYSIAIQSPFFLIFSAILATIAIILRPRWFTVTWFIAIPLTAMVLMYPWTSTLAIALFLGYLMILLFYWGLSKQRK